MIYLVNDILDFSQMEQKSFLVNIQQVNVRDVIQECISMLQFKAEMKFLDLSY